MSIRYMRMKPRVSERPIQAWGVRGLVGGEEVGEDGEDFDGVEGESLSRACTTPGSEGVRGGSLVLFSDGRSSEITGPGRLKGSPA